MLEQLTEVLGADPADLPAVFLSDKPKPLKIGIYRDLRDRYPAARPKTLFPWLRRWTRSHQYLEALAKGGVRFDLEGQMAGEITAIDRAYARATLERYRKSKTGAPVPSAGGSVSSRRGSRKPTLHLPSLAREGAMSDHLCTVCGKYGTRSNYHGKTWRCPAHEPKREKDRPIPQRPHAAGEPSWDPCQCCEGKGCPWRAPEGYGLPPRKEILK